MTFYLTLSALLLSAFPIFLLCAGDPKRRRASGEGDGSTSRQRWPLMIAACAPGLVSLLLGDSATFMLWLGGAALIGWLAATSFAARGRG
ncbi:hypothetical protein LQ953_09695 [Sphingomonas sp. IC-56]|nr:hypothetical protein [Sphingomonas sp. IC-56]